jgi:hypothetical protein
MICDNILSIYFIMNITLLVIVAICIIVIIVTYNTNYNTNNEQFENGLTSSEKIKLLQCMTAIHELFDENDIWYEISFGTLLGAVRHRGFIPWDDDMDLIVKLSDLDKIRAVCRILEKMGYVTEETYKLLRVYSDEKHFIDLFLIAEDNGKIMRCFSHEKQCTYPDADASWWHDYFGFDSQFIFPRKLYQFGSLYLWGPVNSWQLLRFWYGDDFLTVCKTHYLKNHNEIVTPEKEMCKHYGNPQF